MYPTKKITKHSGDSHIIYESGLRDPEDPFSKTSFDKLLDEVETTDKIKSKYTIHVKK